LGQFLRIIELFTKKIVKKLLKIWPWDPGSEIRDPEKTYPGSRIQGSKSTQARILDPGSGSATLSSTSVARLWQEFAANFSKNHGHFGTSHRQNFHKYGLFSGT
jgi:hypothetical protein